MSEFHYPGFRDPRAERSVSEITALLYRCSKARWSKACSLEIARFSDAYGDGITALVWAREARRSIHAL
jgi:hypothetical protein